MQVEEDVTGAGLIVHPHRDYVLVFLQDSGSDLNRTIPVEGLMVDLVLVNLLAVDPDRR